MNIFSSTIIPTINRATLPRTVNSVLNQRLDGVDFEVVVVNDSGQSLPDADWQHSPRVRILNTDHCERSIARNTGAAVANGAYLHFLDDDDILCPGALHTFWQLSRSSRAAWLHGGYQTVDNEGKVVSEYHPDFKGNVFGLLVAGESIPLQASLIQAKAFFQTSQFDPGLIGVEDRDLGRRIALIGEIDFTSEIVANIRIGEAGSTTVWSRLAEDDRKGREKALDMGGAYHRIRRSLTSSYWHGRVTKAYFGSTIWNLKHKRMTKMCGRFISGLAIAGLYIFSPGFWDGFTFRIE